MPIIKVKKNSEGQLYCDPDLKDHSIGALGKKVKWHAVGHNDEFVLIFRGKNPFNENTGNTSFESGNNGKIEEDVKDHSGEVHYLYDIRPQGFTEQKGLDPGLIVRP